MNRGLILDSHQLEIGFDLYPKDFAWQYRG